MAFGLGKSEKHGEDEEETTQESVADSGVTPEQGENGARGATATAEAEKPTARGEGEDGGKMRTPEFRPSFLEESGEPTAAKAPTTPPPDGDTFFITVTRDGNTEIHNFTTPAEAQAFVEEILGAGIQEDAVAAFTGRKLDLKVSHRPVVKLLGGNAD